MSFPTLPYNVSFSPRRQAEKVINLTENFKSIIPIYFQLYLDETVHAYEKQYFS